MLAGIKFISIYLSLNILGCWLGGWDYYGCLSCLYFIDNYCGLCERIGWFPATGAM